MKHVLDKDKKNRQLLKKYEYKRLILKSLIYNIIIPITIRENINNILINYKKGSKVALRNRCVFTFRPRYVFIKYKVSRLMFKRLVILGKIMGVYKKTW